MPMRWPSARKNSCRWLRSQRAKPSSMASASCLKVCERLAAKMRPGRGQRSSARPATRSTRTESQVRGTGAQHGSPAALFARGTGAWHEETGGSAVASGGSRVAACWVEQLEQGPGELASGEDAQDVGGAQAARADVAEVIAMVAVWKDRERHRDRTVVAPARGVKKERELLMGRCAHSRVSSATAFLAQASSTSSLPSAAAARS